MVLWQKLQVAKEQDTVLLVRVEEDDKSDVGTG